MFDTWLDNVAIILGCTDVVAGIILSLVITTALVLISLGATRGRSAIGILIITYMMTGMFTVIGWLPYWFELVLVLLTAGMYGSKIKEWLSK